MNISNIEIEDMIKLMNENDLAHLKIKRGKLSIEISKNNKNYGPVTNIQSPNQASNIIQESSSAEFGTKETLKTVNSPLVGTFYRASAPDKESFVEVGDQVSKGDTLCIVEAMKSMNEIKAEFNGIISEICVENAQPVEYKQILFKFQS